MTDLLVLLVGASALLMLAVVFIRYEEQSRMEESQLAYRLTFPRELGQSDVLNFVRSLTGLLPSAHHRPFGLPGIVFEVWADAKGITHRLRVPEEFADFVVAQLRTSMPGINVVRDEEDYEYPTSWPR